MIAPINNIKDEDLNVLSAWVTASEAAKLLSHHRTQMQRIVEKGRLDCRMFRGKAMYYLPQLATYTKPPMGNPDRIKSDELYLSKQSQDIVDSILDECKAAKDDCILGVRVVGKWAVLQQHRVIDNKKVLVKEHKLQPA